MKYLTFLSSIIAAASMSALLICGAAAAESDAAMLIIAEETTAYGADASPVVLVPDEDKKVLLYNASNPAHPYSAEFSVGIPEIANTVNVRVTYSTQETAAHEVILSSGNESVVLVSDTSVSRGNTVTTEALDIPVTLAKKIAENGKLSLSFSATAPGAVIKLEKLVFSFSEEQAYSYFGDSRKTSSGGIAIKFGPGGNAAFYGTGSDGMYGQHMYFEIMDSLMINKCEKPYRGSNYMAMVKFSNPFEYSKQYSYIRILYRAVTDTESVDIKLYNNKSGEFADLGKVVKTDGFVLTPPVKLPDGHIARYAEGSHCTLTFNDPAAHSNYFVKGIYFFKSEEDARLFTENEEKQVSITLMGKNISEYQIVIPKDVSYLLRRTSKTLQSAIKEKTGSELRIVYSDAPVADAEIVLGYAVRGEVECVDLRYIKAEAKDGRLYFDGLCDEDTDRLVTRFSELFFEVGKPSDSEIRIENGASLVLDASVDYTGYPYPAAAEPKAIKYSFNTADDMKFWDDPDGGWTHVKTVYKCAAEALRITESKLYDADISLDLTFAISSASENSAFGVMLRKNGDDGYVKLEYSPNSGMLTAYVKSSYISRELPVAKTGLLLAGGLEYSMKVSLVGTHLSVNIGNSTVLECDGIYYTAPGKAALFAKEMSVSVGKCDAVLYSSIGRVLGEAVFNETVLMQRGGDSNYRIPSLIATNSGTLIAAANDRRYTVADNAKEQWLVIRRKPLGGEWEELRVLAADKDVSYAIGTFVYDDVNDVIFLMFGSRIAVSRDDGLTWEIRKNTLLKNELGKNGGTHGASAGFTLKYGEHNGRLITAARFSFSGTGSSSELLKTNHYNCTLYSDDGGLTWQTGGPVQVGTGEGTLIERADGTLVYNSRAYFNDHLRRVAYSYDGGATFENFEDSWELLEVTHGVNASMLRAEIGCGQAVTLFSNPYPTADMMGTGNRRNMTVCLSLDEGRSWVAKKTAHEAYSAYSCLAYNKLTDTFFLLYESGPTNSSSYDNISVIEFNLEWLLDT